MCVSKGSRRNTKRWSDGWVWSRRSRAAWEAKINVMGREMLRSRSHGDLQRLTSIAELMLHEMQRMQRHNDRVALLKRLDEADRTEEEGQ